MPEEAAQIGFDAIRPQGLHLYRALLRLQEHQGDFTRIPEDHEFLADLKEPSEKWLEKILSGLRVVPVNTFLYRGQRERRYAIAQGSGVYAYKSGRAASHRTPMVAIEPLEYVVAAGNYGEGSYGVFSPGSGFYASSSWLQHPDKDIVDAVQEMHSVYHHFGTTDLGE